MKNKNDHIRARFSVCIPGQPSIEKYPGVFLTRRTVRAFTGLVRVVSDGDDYFGSGEPFRDRVLEDPTWGSLLSAASRMMTATRDLHHEFFEGFAVVGAETRRPDGRSVTLLRLCMGS